MTKGFMAVTCHYIDESFKLDSTLLDCFPMTERHTADNLASELVRIAAEWDITGKVVACVSDNASNIRVAINAVGEVCALLCPYY